MLPANFAEKIHDHLLRQEVAAQMHMGDSGVQGQLPALTALSANILEMHPQLRMHFRPVHTDHRFSEEQLQEYIFLRHRANKEIAEKFFGKKIIHH